MKLHLGSGTVRLNGWLNVDLATPEADLLLDVRKTLPFADESVTHIFTEHLIEHITREEAVNFLKECYRVLTKNGILRLSTPNLKHLVISYISREIGEWGSLWQPQSPCSLLNEGIRNWGHQFVYDAEELFKVMSEAGFFSVVFVCWGQSTINELSGLETRPFHDDLIIEARKDDGVSTFSFLTTEHMENENWLEALDRSTLKKILNKSKRATVERDVKINNLKRFVADQITHARNIEAELEARGKHFTDLEKNIADLTNHNRNIEAELEARGQHIAALEQIIADMTNSIRNVEADWAARGQNILALEQTIADQTNHIRNIHAEITKYQSSWYGKLKSAKQKLHQLLKPS